MKRPSNYNTKQREAVLDYIISHCDERVTASQIVEHFERENIPISRTTVFRHLIKLTLEGKLHKYSVSGISGACYQYIDNKENCQEHLILKCENCGELLQLRCDVLSDIHKHILEAHTFKVDTVKTVFYGKCESCIRDI